MLSNGTNPAVLTGKNGFQSTVGEIKLLANAVTTVDTAGGTLDGNVELRGDGNVTILIDGRKSTFGSNVDMIAAEMVEKVEVNKIVETV